MSAAQWWMWCRKTWPILPVALALHALNMVVWRSWMESWVDLFAVLPGSAILVAPAAGAWASLTLHRAWPAGLAEHTGTLPRRAAPGLQVATAVTIHVWVAHLLALGVGAVVCASLGVDTTGLMLPWQVLPYFPALWAASLMGVAATRLVDSMFTPPAVFLGLYLGHMVLFSWRFPPLFSPDMPTGSVLGFRPEWTHLAVATAANVCLAASLTGVVMMLASRPRRWWSTGGVLTIVGALGVVLGIVATRLWLPLELYREL